MRFEQLVTERTQPLLRLAFLLTGDRHLAEDVTQTALLGAFRSWQRVETARDPEAYVRRMLVNAAVDRGRRRSSTEVPTDVPDDLPSPDGGPWPDLADAVVDRDELRRALAGLPPRARAVLVLRYYADLDDGEIAGLLGIGESSVRSSAARALAALRAGGVGAVTEEGTR